MAAASAAAAENAKARDEALETLRQSPKDCAAHVDLACLLTTGEVVTLPDGRRMNDLELCKEGIRLDPANGRAYAHLASTLCTGGSIILANGRRMTQHELYLKTLRHDPTNSAAYDHLAMMADEADPIAYFAQVAALAAAEEAGEGMQAPLPPLWPRVLHLLADLKLPPDSTPGARIPLPAILRAVRSSNEHLQTLGLRAMARFTEDENRAAMVPLEVITWLGRVLWCSESMPSLVHAVTIIGRLADVPSARLAPFLRATPRVVPRLVTLGTWRDARLAESVMSALRHLTMNCDVDSWKELHELKASVIGYLASRLTSPANSFIVMWMRRSHVDIFPPWADIT
jgi:hypothetical protein